MTTNEDKWYLSIITTFLFYIISLPATYEYITNPIVEDITGIKLERKGKATIVGVILHSFLFLMIIRYMMEMKINLK
jgi:hypothetical protein